MDAKNFSHTTPKVKIGDVNRDLRNENDKGCWGFVGTILLLIWDISVPILYLADVVTDIIILIGYYEKGWMEYFDIGIAFWSIGPALSLILAIITIYKDFHRPPGQQRLRSNPASYVWVMISFPILPLYVWIVNYCKLKDYVLFVEIEEKQFRGDQVEQYKQMVDQYAKEVDITSTASHEALMRRAFREAGLFVEASTEAIPLSILQFFVQLQTGEFTPLAIGSIMISLMQILSKCYALGIDRTAPLKVYISMFSMSCDILVLFLMSLATFFASFGHPEVLQSLLLLYYIRAVVGGIVLIVIVFDTINDTIDDQEFKDLPENIIGALFLGSCVAFFVTVFPMQMAVVAIRHFWFQDGDRRTDSELLIEQAARRGGRSYPRHLGVNFTKLRTGFLQRRAQINKPIRIIPEKVIQKSKGIVFLARLALVCIIVMFVTQIIFPFVLLIQFTSAYGIGFGTEFNAIAHVQPGALILKDLMVALAIIFYISAVALTVNLVNKTNEKVHGDMHQSQITMLNLTKRNLGLTLERRKHPNMSNRDMSTLKDLGLFVPSAYEY